jgi:hypothetical protein
MTPAAKDPKPSNAERQEALTPEQLLEKRPANRARVDAHKEQMTKRHNITVSHETAVSTAYSSTEKTCCTASAQ